MLQLLVGGLEGLGSRLSRRFATLGLDTEISELRGQPPRPADFEP